MVGKGDLKRQITDYRIGETVEYRNMTEEELKYLEDFNGLLSRKIHKQPVEETIEQYGNVIKSEEDYNTLYSYVNERRDHQKCLVARGVKVSSKTDLMPEELSRLRQEHAICGRCLKAFEVCKCEPRKQRVNYDATDWRVEELTEPEGGFIDMIDDRDREAANRPYGDLLEGHPDGTKVRVAIPNHYLEAATGEIVGYRVIDRMYEVKITSKGRHYNCIFFRYELTLETSKVIGCPGFYRGGNIR